MLVVLLVTISAALLSVAGAAEHAPPSTIEIAQDGNFKVYLPLISKGGASAQPLPPGKLPATLIGTWFGGAIPPTDFYNPATGQWRDTNGLGQLYMFGADGGYTYAGFLRLQNGQCRTEVSTYQQGQAQATGATLTLTPGIAKTRTVVVCGSRSDSTTNGPFAPKTIGWATGANDNGIEQLTLTDSQATTSFYKQGMAESLVGAWHRGAVVSTAFYDQTTQSFAPQSDAGAWFRFNADGTYSFGEFGYGQNEQGCALSGWIYQEGTVSVSGGQLTITPKAGMARVESDCDPEHPQQKPYVEAGRAYTWLFRDRAADPKLVLIPLDYYQELVFTRE
jgi:hypothetical protein